MSTFPRFNKIFIFIIFISLILLSCGGKPDEKTKTGATVDPDLIYHEENPSDPTTEIVSGTMPFSQEETAQITENTAAETITQTTEVPETIEETEETEEITGTETTEKAEENTEPPDLYVITPSGKKYHYQTCRTVKSIKQYLTKEEAEKLGYEPCKICNPK